VPVERGKEEGNEMKCRICGEEANENVYCEVHRKAQKNLVEKYELWKEACEVSWEEYLSEVVKNPFTGEWVKAVAEYLIKRGEQ
jgi:hypothetical protein